MKYRENRIKKNPGRGARFSSPVQTGPVIDSASSKMGTGSFPRVKRPALGANHLAPSIAEVTGTVELYLYFPPGPT